MTDLWDAVGPEIDAEHATLRLTRAKVACASLWPFLAIAATEREFEHRLALADEHIVARVEADLIEPVVASLRQDFAAMPKLALEDDANQGQGNPYYFTGGEEAGPATGETNQYPPHPTGADPADPINGQYPAQPQPWSGGPGWVERPMNFGTTGGRLPFSLANGDPNPNFFSGGSEGIEGEDGGFPQDVTLPEPDERVDSYGVTAGKGTVEHEGPDSDADEGTTFHSDAERERAGDKDRENAKKGNRFFDPYDPSIQMTAAGDPYGSDNPFAQGGGTAEGGVPETPSSLTGGPGSFAQTSDGGVPLTTSPRQMPGGGGMGGGMAPVPQENTPGNGGGMGFAAFMRHGESQELFSDERPTGLPDPYQETQFERAQHARPRIDMADMHINTPQNPNAREPIRTINSDPSGVRDEEEEER